MFIPFLDLPINLIFFFNTLSEGPPNPPPPEQASNCKTPPPPPCILYLCVGLNPEALAAPYQASLNADVPAEFVYTKLFA